MLAWSWGFCSLEVRGPFSPLCRNNHLPSQHPDEKRGENMSMAKNTTDDKICRREIIETTKPDPPQDSMVHGAALRRKEAISHFLLLPGCSTHSPVLQQRQQQHGFSGTATYKRIQQRLITLYSIILSL